MRDVVLESGADTIICDGELSPSQLRNLEQRLAKQPPELRDELRLMLATPSAKRNGCRTASRAYPASRPWVRPRRHSLMS